ncbi:hypothetical protein MTO96_012279 [Rhipicephalus appendiculatus]
MACLLASRLCHYLLTTLEERPERVVLWTDSAIALYWIRGNGRKWQEFVRNRVLEIQASTGEYTWRHCPGKENPADLLTRGRPASHLATCELWWTGPLWVRLPESEWPQGFPETTFTDTELEQKRETKVLPTTVSPTPPNDLVDVKRFSSFTKLIRVTAWVLRFVAKARRKDFECGVLTATELNRAELVWIRHEQKKGLLREFMSVQERRQLPAESPLRNTLLMIDERGVLRISGRLQQSNMSYEAKHPSPSPKDARGGVPWIKSRSKELECGSYDFPARKANALKVYCWNEAHGCEFQGSMEDMLRHFEKECTFHSVECLRCGEGVLHRDLDNALRSRMQYKCFFSTRREHVVGNLEL